MIDWRQLGEDFRQKYESTYCRYISPINNEKEVFYLNKVRIYNDEPAAITLFNRKHGEIFLSYNTEAELDFSYPRCGYFQCDDKALLFRRNYERQYKKGVCHSTARVFLPYPHTPWIAKFDETMVSAAFQDTGQTSISSGVRALKDGAFSIVLSPTLALGLSNTEAKWWLWYEEEPIAEVTEDSIVLKAHKFLQEILDHIRDTQDHARTII